MNPYEVLGVDTRADARGIRAAYRKLSAIHHPDKETGDEEKFKEVKLAYDILSDPERRRRYDTLKRTDESRATPERVCSFIEQTMNQVIVAQRRDGSTDDPIFENIRDKILATLMASRVEISRRRQEAIRRVGRCKELQKRFIPSCDFDPVGSSLKKELDRLEGELREQEDALELSIEVEGVLKTYEYKVGPELEGQYSPGPTTRLLGGSQVVFSRSSRGY